MGEDLLLSRGDNQTDRGDLEGHSQCLTIRNSGHKHKKFASFDERSFSLSELIRAT